MPILKLTKPINNFPQVQIKIDYNLGGINYFNNKEEKRGYYIRFSPCIHKEVGNGIYSTEMQPMHERSFKICIKEVNRKSLKTHNALLAIFNHHLDNILKEYEKSNEDCIKYVINIFNL